MMDFKIGDLVRVIDDGQQYTTYEKMAGLLCLDNFVFNYEIENGVIGTIVGLHKSPIGSTLYIGVKLSGDDREIIINERGVELVDKVPAELFTI